MIVRAPMTAITDGEALQRMRRISRALTGKAPYRLEVALAVTQLDAIQFSAGQVAAQLGEGESALSHNVSRNLQSFVAAGYLRQDAPGSAYWRESTPFWEFVRITWERCLEESTPSGSESP
jgi:hypothetical protein